MFSSSEPKYSSTINGSLSIAGVAIVVTSATNFPTVGSGQETWVRIGQGTVNEETVRVTARSGTTLTCDALANNHSTLETITAADVNVNSLAQIRMDALAMGPEVLITATGATGTIGKMHRLTAASSDYTVTVPDGTKDGQVIGFRVNPTSTFFPTISGKLTAASTKTRLMWGGESGVGCGEAVTFIWDTTLGGWAVRDCVIHPMIGHMWLNAAQAAFPSAQTAPFQLINLDTIDIDNTGKMCNGTTHEITLKRKGKYIGSIQVVGTGAVTQIWEGRLHKNSTTVSILTAFGNLYHLSAYTGCSASRPFDGVAADVMTLRAYQNSGGALGPVPGSIDQTFMSITEIPAFVVV